MPTTLCSKTLKKSRLLHFFPHLLSFAPSLLRAAVMDSRGNIQWVHLYSANPSAASTELMSSSSWASFLLLASRTLSASCRIGPPESIAGFSFPPNSERWDSYSSLLSSCWILSDVCIPTARLRSTFCPHSGSKRIICLKPRLKAVYCYKGNEGYIKQRLSDPLGIIAKELLACFCFSFSFNVLFVLLGGLQE